VLGAVTGLFGTVSSCITGPTNAINSQPSSGALEDRYVASIVTGLTWFLFGLISPVGASIARILPFKIGAFFAFLITISNLSIYNIGAPFWGIVGGLLASLIFERQDFRPSSKDAP
jgi:benzoate membrane transport protein